MSSVKSIHKKYFEILSTWLNRLDKILKYLIAFGMALIMFAVVFHVFGRYFFGKTYMGTLELVRYTVIWISMLGAACAFKTGEHVAINFFQDRLKAVIWFWIYLFGNLMLLIFLITMIIGGITISIRNWNQVSLGLQIPMLFPYLAIPVGGLVILPYVMHNIMRAGLQFLFKEGES